MLNSDIGKFYINMFLIGTCSAKIIDSESEGKKGNTSNSTLLNPIEGATLAPTKMYTNSYNYKINISYDVLKSSAGVQFCKQNILLLSSHCTIIRTMHESE